MHIWPFGKSKFNLKSDRVTLFASTIECLLYLTNVWAIHYRLGNSNVLQLPVYSTIPQFFLWKPLQVKYGIQTACLRNQAVCIKAQLVAWSKRFVIVLKVLKTMNRLRPISFKRFKIVILRRWLVIEKSSLNQYTLRTKLRKWWMSRLLFKLSYKWLN